MLNLKYNKAMLILFIILLGLLTITSAIGGGIKVTENFWDDLPQIPTNQQLPNDKKPVDKLVSDQQLEKNKPPVLINESSSNDSIKTTNKDEVIEPFSSTSFFAGAAPF
jgi:hypothetical protein